MMAIPFPIIDPVAITLGPLKVHWYALAYVIGTLLGLWWAKIMIRRYPVSLTEKILEDFAYTPLILGMVLGGRLGHVIFYDFSYYLVHPLEILMTWKGGMSFHGGLLGVIIGAFFFLKARKVPFFSMMDVAAIACPIGLGLGRLANFINGELYGRVTNAPWGIIFPGTEGLPRHPTQLYEAISEGMILWLVLSALFTKKSIRLKSGTISGCFLLLYGVMRFIIEFFKDPLAQGSSFDMTLTHGHWLCIPMILGGILILYYAQRCSLDTLSKKSC